MSWILIGGKEDLVLESELAEISNASLKKHNFAASSLTYLKKLDRSISLSGEYSAQNEILIEKLRSLCKFWDVDPTVGQVSSHRKYIGPTIVKAKMAVFSILRVLLKPSYEKQRNFNAQVIELLTEIIKK